MYTLRLPIVDWYVFELASRLFILEAVPKLALWVRVVIIIITFQMSLISKIKYIPILAIKAGLIQSQFAMM